MSDLGGDSLRVYNNAGNISTDEAMDEVDMSDPERKHIQSLFEQISKGKEDLDVHVFHSILTAMDIKLPFPLTRIVFEAIDDDDSGKIDFPEFFKFVSDENSPLTIKSEYTAVFENEKYGFSIVSRGKEEPCIIVELDEQTAKEKILPRSSLLKVNDVDVSRMEATEVEIELRKAWVKTPTQVTLTLHKKVTKANLALMVEQGPWAMVQRDVEIERRKKKQEIERASHEDGWHCPREDGIRKMIFQTFEDDKFGPLAFFIQSFVMILIFVSTAAYVIETIPNIGGAKFLVYIEVFVSSCFSIEYTVRIFCCRNAWIFFWDYMNMIDFLSVIPFWLELCLEGGEGGAMLRVIRVIRLARVFRLLKSPRFKDYLEVLYGALIKSGPSFTLLLTIFTLAIIVCASLMFVAEQGVEQPDGTYTMKTDGGKESRFRSIFSAFWWCIVTMTCVGYGDMYPVTPLGQALGVLSMFVGLLVIALPVIIIGGNFDEMYQDFRRKLNYKKRKLLLQKTIEQERIEMGMEDGQEVVTRKRTEDYFYALNSYILSTCEDFQESDAKVVQFFTVEDIANFVEEGYDTQEEIIAVLKKGPAGCYFLPETIKRWKLFALYEIFAKKHQMEDTDHKKDPYHKLRLAFFNKTKLADDWEAKIYSNQEGRGVTV